MPKLPHVPLTCSVLGLVAGRFSCRVGCRCCGGAIAYQIRAGSAAVRRDGLGRGAHAEVVGAENPVTHLTWTFALSPRMLDAAYWARSAARGRVRHGWWGSVFRRCGCVDPVTGRQYGTRCPRLAGGGRHGSWYVRLELPGGLDGRRRRIRRGGYPSRKAALEVLARLRNPRAGGTGGIITVGTGWPTGWSPAPPRRRPRSAAMPRTFACTWHRTWGRCS